MTKRRKKEWVVAERFDGRTAQYVLNHKPDAALEKRIRAFLVEELWRARRATGSDT